MASWGAWHGFSRRFLFKKRSWVTFKDPDCSLANLVVSVTEGLILTRIKRKSLRLCGTEVNCPTKTKKECNRNKASHLALFLDIICQMTRSLNSGKKVLISCSVRMGIGFNDISQLLFLCHTHRCQTVSHFIYNSSWAHFFVSTFLLSISSYNLAADLPNTFLFFLSLESISLHVLHALLIHIKEYSPIREMPSL